MLLSAERYNSLSQPNFKYWYQNRIFVHLEEKKATVLLSIVELCSVKNIDKKYQFSPCLIQKSLKKLSIFEILF